MHSVSRREVSVNCYKLNEQKVTQKEINKQVAGVENKIK